MTWGRLTSMVIRREIRQWRAVEDCKILVIVPLSGKCQDLCAKQSISIYSDGSMRLACVNKIHKQNTSEASSVETRGFFKNKITIVFTECWRKVITGYVCRLMSHQAHLLGWGRRARLCGVSRVHWRLRQRGSDWSTREICDKNILMITNNIWWIFLELRQV